MNHTLVLRLSEEISTTSDMQDATLMAEKEEQLKSLLIKVKEESGKATTFKKLRSWHPASLLDGKPRKSRNSDRLYFLVLQNHCGR